jgi:phage shock protein PspC (stress-responsive transcriptional regulator)
MSFVLRKLTILLYIILSSILENDDNKLIGR